MFLDMLYEDAEEMVEYLAQALKQTSREATILLYSPGDGSSPAEDDGAGRPGVLHLQRAGSGQRQEGRGEDARSPENARGIFTWWPWKAPAQKRNSLRQRPQNVALEAAQVLRCLYLQHPYKMLLRRLDCLPTTCRRRRDRTRSAGPWSRSRMDRCRQ